MSDDLRERVAVLESTESVVIERLDQMDKTLNDISKQITRFHGAIGMLAFVVSGIGIAWQIFGGWIKSHWQ